MEVTPRYKLLIQQLTSNPMSLLLFQFCSLVLTLAKSMSDTEILLIAFESR